MSSSSHHQYRVDPHQRRTIVRSCKSRGWTVHPEALALMDEQVEALKYNGSAETTAEALSTLLDGLRPHLKGSRTVTEQVWNDWVEASQPVVATNHNPANSNNISKSKMPTTTTPTSSSSSLNLQVVQAFQTPKLVFQGMRRQFLVEDPSTGSLLGSAEDKV
jgi:hypothetical protein